VQEVVDYCRPFSYLTNEQVQQPFIRKVEISITILGAAKAIRIYIQQP